MGTRVLVWWGSSTPFGLIFRVLTFWGIQRDMLVPMALPLIHFSNFTCNYNQTTRKFIFAHAVISMITPWDHLRSWKLCIRTRVFIWTYYFWIDTSYIIFLVYKLYNISCYYYCCLLPTAYFFEYFIIL